MSNYKSHNTVKFLIGIIPQGVVFCLSKGWNGQISDKEPRENYGLLNFLGPGEIVLADREFMVQDSVGLCCAELKSPPFTRGRKTIVKT